MSTLTEKPHHLAGKPKSLEQRAKIAASKVLRSRGLSPDEDLERWESEYEIALFRLRMRQSEGRPSP